MKSEAAAGSAHSLGTDPREKSQGLLPMPPGAPRGAVRPSPTARRPDLARVTWHGVYSGTGARQGWAKWGEASPRHCLGSPPPPARSWQGWARLTQRPRIRAGDAGSSRGRGKGMACAGQGSDAPWGPGLLWVGTDAHGSARSALPAPNPHKEAFVWGLLQEEQLAKSKGGASCQNTGRHRGLQGGLDRAGKAGEAAGLGRTLTRPPEPKAPCRHCCRQEAPKRKPGTR